MKTLWATRNRDSKFIHIWSRKPKLGEGVWEGSEYLTTMPSDIFKILTGRVFTNYTLMLRVCLTEHDGMARPEYRFRLDRSNKPASASTEDRIADLEHTMEEVLKACKELGERA